MLYNQMVSLTRLAAQHDLAVLDATRILVHPDALAMLYDQMVSLTRLAA
jgi:hypothetical protein